MEEIGQMILYVGPDQIIPLSGVLGTVIGIALIYWGKLLEGLRKVSSLLFTKHPPRND